MWNRLLGLYRKYKRIINYLIVGVMTTVVALAAYYACVYTFLDPRNPLELQAANVISWVLAVTFAYFTNRKFVFESTNPDMLKEAASFYTARVGTLLLEMAFLALTVSVMHLSDKLMKPAAQFLVIIANYIFSKLFVFKEKNRQ